MDKAVDKRVERQRSILRTSGAAQTEKRTNNVHYPEASQLLSIVTPSDSSFVRPKSEIHGATVSAAGGDESVGSGSAHGGSVAGGSRNEDLLGLRALVNDFGSLSEDSTPLSQTLQEQLDFSVVLGQGPTHNKYNQHYESGPPYVTNSGTKWPTIKQKQESNAPEKKITLFAFRLALIEKAASGLGTIAFLWATVVILGGFASTIRLTDFLVSTVIILAETSRIFSRSHELEWQHLSSKSNIGFGISTLMNAARTFSRKRNREESKHGSRKILHPARSMSAPARLPGSRRVTKTPSPLGRGPSPDAELITPTNSSSTSSRHNRKKQGEILPTSTPTAARQPRTDTWLHAHAKKLFTTEGVSRVLLYAQIVSAVVCVGLSLWRLAVQKFSDVPHQPNVKVSMNVFYVLAVLEAGLFLAEKAYWEYRIQHKKLLQVVCGDDHVGKENMEVVTHFFYDVYAECLKGSVFDGLDMDLVQYCITMLQSEDFKEQMGGARVLNRFVSFKQKLRQDEVAADALRKLGTTPGIIERLVEMLSWGSQREEGLLMEVSTIICRLVVYNRNCARFVAVPGALDGLVALLTRDDRLISESKFSPPFFLRLMGLRILKYLCKDHKNSLKIGETRGLLSVLMVFIEVRAGKDSFETHNQHENDAIECRMKTYKKSLQVLFLLASATNTSGGILRKRIAAIVSGLKNLRDIIQCGKKKPELQRIAIEIINHLAMEDDVRKIIGATGGIIRNLFKLFRKYDNFEESETDNETAHDKKIREERKLASMRAGETLTRLVLQNEKNCLRVLGLEDKRNRKQLIPVMVGALSKDDEIATSAAQILRSVLKYADDSSKREIASKTADVVVDNMFHRSGGNTKTRTMYEASLGLAARSLESLDDARYREILQHVHKIQFVQQLVRNLHHTPTTNRYPRIRRYTVELIIALIEKDNEFMETFERNDLNLKRVLEITLDSTSEVENYCLFSGLVGYTRHLEDIEHLLERAISSVENARRRTPSAEYLT